MVNKKWFQIIGILFLCFMLSVSLVDASPNLQEETPFSSQAEATLDEPAPQQSTTGPTPPAEVILRDSQKPEMPDQAILSETVISGVPAYVWRYGCGPTAGGMVRGYYDGLGFSDLVPGDASSQTDDVDQMIASGGEWGSLMPPGSEGHYEDYASPEDYYPTMLDDDYITASRTPHTDNSLADYMHTSMSTYSNYYGWSWSSDLAPAFVSYVNQQNSSYQASHRGYYWSSGTLTWDVLKNEIDAGRPMVFLVDTNADGATDHFVTVIGYRETTRGPEYGMMDTWSENIHWESFAGIANGVYWGIWGGWGLYIMNADVDSYEPDDNALESNLLEVAQDQTHAIKPVGDEDWVHFTVTYHSAVTLTTSGAGGDDTRMWLYDDTLSEIEFNDDGGTDNYAQIDRVCGVDALPAGDYYVKVDEYEGNDDIDAYTLSLSTSFCLMVDLFEPDDSYAQANSLASMDFQNHSIYPAGDQDWITFNVADLSEVYIGTWGTTDDDTVLYLYDSNLDQVEFNDNTDWSNYGSIDRLCAVDPLPAGTYYAMAAAAQPEDEIALYQLNLYTHSCMTFQQVLPFIFQTGP